METVHSDDFYMNRSDARRLNQTLFSSRLAVHLRPQPPQRPPVRRQNLPTLGKCWQILPNFVKLIEF